MADIIKVAVCGLGSRGRSYSECCKSFPDKIKIVACADIDADKLKRYGDEYGIPENMRFASGEEMLKQDKLADIMFICTMDRQHYGHAIPALKKGYHLLLEKPASPDPKECLEIARVAKENNREVIVCHVLRYTSYWRKIKEIMDSGVIGDIMSIQADEQVVYWHQAHSFVRGNWRNKAESSPMILQKCCHDMDIFLWITGKHAVSVSSFGQLTHLKKENAPAGAPMQCSEKCPEFKTCPYSIEECYMKNVREGQFGWPMDVVSPIQDVDNFREVLKTSQYGRCVYHCDNTVVDHQVVNLLLEDDITLSFNMCAFTSQGGRRLHVMGSKGDIYSTMEDDTITVTKFGEKPQNVDCAGEYDQFGHGGGDAGIIVDVIKVLSGEKKALTSIDASIESHIVCLAAEESRENGGKLVTIDDYIKEQSL